MAFGFPYFIKELFEGVIAAVFNYKLVKLFALLYVL
jgi:hypothetical protein